MRKHVSGLITGSLAILAACSSSKGSSTDVSEGPEFTYYRDSDGDGFGDQDDSVNAAAAPDGYVSATPDWDWDCDDSDAAIYPEAAERCDGIDNDCDGVLDVVGGDCFSPAKLHPSAGRGWFCIEDTAGALNCRVGDPGEVKFKRLPGVQHPQKVWPGPSPCALVDAKILCFDDEADLTYVAFDLEAAGYSAAEIVDAEYSPSWLEAFTVVVVLSDGSLMALDKGQSGVALAGDAAKVAWYETRYCYETQTEELRCGESNSKGSARWLAGGSGKLLEGGFFQHESGVLARNPSADTRDTFVLNTIPGTTGAVQGALGVDDEICGRAEDGRTKCVGGLELGVVDEIASGLGVCVLQGSEVTCHDEYGPRKVPLPENLDSTDDSPVLGLGTSGAACDNPSDAQPVVWNHDSAGLISCIQECESDLDPEACTDACFTEGLPEELTTECQPCFRSIAICAANNSPDCLDQVWTCGS